MKVYLRFSKILPLIEINLRLTVETPNRIFGIYEENLYCKYDTLFIDKMQFFFRLTCLFVFIFLQIQNKKTST